MKRPKRIFTRRNALVFFGAAAASFGLGYALRRFGGGDYADVDWQRAFERKTVGGIARIKSLVGEGLAGMRELMLGGGLNSGERIRVARDSLLILSLPDRSVLQIRGEAELDLHFDEFSGGVYNLYVGAVLSVVPRSNLYIATGPTGAVGIKGTVFFREVFGETGREVQTMEGKMTMPADVDDYFCTCHGEVDYLGQLEQGRVVRTDRAQHHSPFFLRNGDGLTFEEAPMLNHFDDEIDRLIDVMDPPRHDKSWLDLAAASRPRG